MSVNFCVSNVWDIKCELGRPMNSHAVVPVSMILFLFTYFFFAAIHQCLDFFNRLKLNRAHYSNIAEWI